MKNAAIITLFSLLVILNILAINDLNETARQNKKTVQILKSVKGAYAVTVEREGYGNVWIHYNNKERLYKVNIDYLVEKGAFRQTFDTSLLRQSNFFVDGHGEIYIENKNREG